MKHLYIFLLLNFSNFVFSQNKAIVPTSGTIVFVKDEIILDKDLYIKSFSEFIQTMKEPMFKEIYLEQMSSGIPVDTMHLRSKVEEMINTMIFAFPFMLEEKEEQEVKFNIEFAGDTIIKYNTINGGFYNEKKISKTSGIVINEYREKVELVNDEIISLKEIRNETKLINGFRCFKIIFSYNESSTSDFDMFSSSLTNTRELWVTDEIKCNYHPIINQSEILEKYYPLEIIEYSEEIKGIITNYKLVEFSLK